MRRLEFATLLMSAVSLVAMGCRQTSGPSTAGPTGPLAPVAAGQTPTLNPFGGPTRVTPPSTGSYSAPNAYIGGPPGQASIAPASPNGFAATQGQVPVGSGVQAAGWTETGSNVATAANPSAFGSNSFAPQSTTGANSVTAAAPSAFGSPAPQAFGTPAPQAFGTPAPQAFGTPAPQAFGSPAPSAFGSTAPTSAPPTNPQLGGMQVIDLTGAPPPPGYQPTQPNYQPSAPAGFQAPAPTVAPAGQSGFQPSSGFQSTPPTSSFQQAPTTGYPTQPGFQTVPEAEIAARMSPIPSTNNSVVPSTSSVPATGPSTDPVSSDTFQNGSSSSLPWRRPGTSF